MLNDNDNRRLGSRELPTYGPGSRQVDGRLQLKDLRRSMFFLYNTSVSRRYVVVGDKLKLSMEEKNTLCQKKEKS